MSVEILASSPQGCPHLVVEEPVPLGGDRRSLTTRAPVANAGTVRVLVNDSLYVPPDGLGTQALLQAGAGPYRIERCTGIKGPDENVLTVNTSSGSRTISLPLGPRVKTEELVRVLRLSPLSEIAEITARNGALAIGDVNTSGPESFVTVSGEGAGTLRFQQRGARGREIYPPWDLVARQDVFPSLTPRNLVPTPARYPQFKRPVKGNPQFKVTYTAMPERCPRCEGTYVENDYQFDLDGGIVAIENEDLLTQACLKAVLTVKGSNPYHPGYGATVSNRIGSKNVRSTAAAIREDVINCLSRVKSLQNEQRKYQRVSDRERIYRITDVTVRPKADDPTVFFLDITVSNGSGVPVEVNIVYSAPGAVALAGTNGKTLGLEPTGLTASQSSPSQFFSR